jgi:hypothetical protein
MHRSSVSPEIDTTLQAIDPSPDVKPTAITLPGRLIVHSACSLSIFALTICPNGALTRSAEPRSVRFRGIWMKAPARVRACARCGAAAPDGAELRLLESELDSAWLGDGGRPTSEVMVAD